MTDTTDTITLTDHQQIAIEIALRDYLTRVVSVHETECAHDSNVANSIRVFNKIQNLRHGLYKEYDLERIPIFMHYNYRIAGESR
jgi:hypothetical protein